MKPEIKFKAPESQWFDSSCSYFDKHRPLEVSQE
jgi:hypothetical protein